MTNSALTRNISEVLLDKQAIDARVRLLGEQITRDYAGKDLLVVGVLTGSVLFLSDLIRKIDLPVEVDMVAVSSYGASTKSSGIVRLLKDLGRPIRDKHVLLIEDIIDTGLTLKYLLETLQARHPSSIEACVLLDKPSRRQVNVPVKYTGFEIEDKFVVGYGLDCAGLYRNLPYIAVLLP